MKKLFTLGVMIFLLAGSIDAAGARWWTTKKGWLGDVAESEQAMKSELAKAGQLAALGKLSTVDIDELRRLLNVHSNRLNRARAAWNYWRQDLGTEKSVEKEFAEADAAVVAVGLLLSQAVENDQGMFEPPKAEPAVQTPEAAPAQ